MSTEIKYSDRISEVETIITKLQTCDDVDDAIKLFETASQHLKQCEQKIEEAQGKFEKIMQPLP